MEHIVLWSATGLAAKMIADALRHRYGFGRPSPLASARRTIETDLAYAIAYVVALAVAVRIGIDAALVVAIVLRISGIVGDRVLLAGNHTFLELYAALVCLRLHDSPVALASSLQVITVSVWLYAAFQKLYQREYHDGTYFYLAMQRIQGPLVTWARRVRQVPSIPGYYAEIDPSARAFCRRLAALVLITETVPPALALVTSGTIWSPLLLLVVVLPVGLLTSETNFMITNVLLAATFLVPFDAAAFLSGLGEPVVAGVVAWCLAWPPVHAVLARRLRFSPSKLAGWGMYSHQGPQIDLVLPNGELRMLRDSAIPARLLHEFGACRIGWLREAIRRNFFRWGSQTAAKALVFRWYRLRGNRFVTSCIVFQNEPGAAPATFEICDEHGAKALNRYVSSLPPAAAQAPQAPAADRARGAGEVSWTLQM
jgi:hypothetical protein